MERVKHMKHLLKIVTHRVFIVGMVILAELFILGFLIFKLTVSFAAIYSALLFIAVFLVLYLINRNDNPVYRFSWAIMILVLPPLGVVLYLMFGGKKVPNQLRERLSDAYGDDPFLKHKSVELIEEVNQVAPQWTRLINYLNKTSHFPVYNNTSGTYFSSGEAKFEVMKTKLKEAKQFIFMEYFIIKEGYVWDEIIKILAQKVKEGVDVRLLYDDWGAANFADIQKECHDAGIQAIAFNPLEPRLAIQMNNRDHRKICVVDGIYGFVGGMNLADEYVNIGSKFGHWKDTAVMIEGDAVHSLTMMFLQFWRFYTGQNEDPDLFKYDFKIKDKSLGYVLPFADAPTDAYNIGADTHLFMITNAKRYVYIQTPYLIIGYEMISALKLAASSGVDVRIVVPHVPDKKLVNQVTKSNYEELIKHGVRIFEYEPGFVHSKTFVVDDEIAIIGTTNMDYRSYYLHFECGIIFIKNKIVEACYQESLDTINNHCIEITMEDVENTSKIVKLFRSVLSIFSGMM